MTRPHIIRADTIDLQDQGAPSAKDHTRQPAHPAPLGIGPPAPHQAGALRHAEEVSEEQQSHTPRFSDDLANAGIANFREESESHDGERNELELDGQTHQDEQAVRQNGGHTGAAGEEAEMSDVDGDDGDDDMMDKISSSPSIDDGGYILPSPWPARADSLISTSSPSSELQPFSSNTMINSFSPSVSTPAHLSISYSQQEGEECPSEDHHQLGGYGRGQEILNRDEVYKESEDESGDLLSPLMSEHAFSYFRENLDHHQASIDTDLDGDGINHLLLPSDDPLLDNSFDDAPLSPSTSMSSSPPSASSWDYEHTNDDDTEDIFFSDDSRFTDSGWGGECLREIEDIDFEFVYALHTFFATVEGQANATKGDTMVLLDDSNSYWWLVRVVKDSSIGYLPAEHIETPTERLARLNKHRNIDLSATMLGDNPEKSKNPLKKAMWRRNAKTVQFCAPTYVEASDVEYSTDEEEGEGDFYGSEGEAAEVQGQTHSGPQESQGDAIAAEPLKVGGSPENGRADGIQRSDAPVENGDGELGPQAEMPRTSDEIYDRQEDGVNGKSRKGTVRNTDSFFKDESVETRKITLTPNILRDDSSNSTVRSNESKELKARSSFDTLEKVGSPTERSKDDKKRREKKPGMLSGLFKRKDKKTRTQDEDVDDSEKLSEEISRLSPQPKVSSESLSQDVQSSKPAQQPQRHPSKLQKAPPANSLKNDQTGQKLSPTKPSWQTQPPPDRPAPIAGAVSPSMRVVSPDVDYRMEDTPAPLRVRSPEQPRETTPMDGRQDLKQSSGVFSPITNALRSSPSSSDPKPEKVKKAKRRVAMDDFDSSPDMEEQADLLEAPQQASIEQSLPAATERLSESPIHVSPIDPPISLPPRALIVDTCSQEEPSISPPSSPELIGANDAKSYEEAPASTSQSPATAPPWSDASLRTYLEDDSEIRDLLVVVHDKSGVVPAGPDHPITGGLFKEENRRLGELSNRLDSMLGDWLARKSKPVQ
ncbi:MAG: hypothetical protein M1830_000785 [Pleopsidium flavum]|nr:MAG: hypothetical protein M1830_000785 [Pleopsidium flavum]